MGTAMATFSVYDGSDSTLLTDALVAADSGIVIQTGSIVLTSSGSEAVNLYDGSLTSLGIGSGLLLTSGTTPGTSNSVSWFGTDNSTPDTFNNGDADINTVVNTVFNTESYDATTLSFSFTADPTASSISFDLVFGSDEYPEWVDQFVDSAIVMVNGVNYALFNHDPLAPLSVVSSNLAAGYFQDNSGNVLPIEYDGVSHVLKIVAPIIPGQVNTIKIGIADTGDHIYDSGIFIANLKAGTTPGSGVVSTPGGGTTSNDSLSGTSQAEYFDLLAGDDTVYAAGGDDIVVAGAGQDKVFGGSGKDELKGDAGNDLLDGGVDDDTAVYVGSSTGYSLSYDASSGSTSIADLSGIEGTDTLTGIEFVKFADGLFTLTSGVLGSLLPVTPPPANTPGQVFISGIGAAGNTLTASVSDADGLPLPVGGLVLVIFQWQISADGGGSWVDVPDATSSTYVVQSTDAGQSIRVVATYTDQLNAGEQPISAAKAISASTSGDLQVTLLHLEAPVGASVINPLTTLVQRAKDLGLSAAEAQQMIRSVFALPANLNLLHYDAYAILQNSPSDPTALAVETLSVQIAILTSLSDDDTGINLTLAILQASAVGHTLNLADTNDLTTILGDGFDEGVFGEIQDRNQSLASDLADHKGVASIEKEWQDLLSVQDGIASTGIADLSIHVNQAPVGSPTQPLVDATQDTAYLLASSDLLAGFTDPEGDPLQVVGLSTDQGGFLTDNGDGTWTFTPDPGFSGPVELAYLVEDGQGGSIAAAQLLVVAAAAVNHSPSGSVAISGLAQQGETLSATNDITDADGIPPGAITYQWFADGAALADATGSTLVLSQELVGLTISVEAAYIDGQGTAESVFSLATDPVLNLEEAATGSVIVSPGAAEGATLTADSSAIQDPDGPLTFTYQWESSTDGSQWSGIAGATALFFQIPSDQSLVGRQIRVQVSSTDPFGGTGSFTSSAQTVANVNDAPTGTVTITGTAVVGATLTAGNTLADEDGIPTSGAGLLTYQWLANGSPVDGATLPTLLLDSTTLGQVITVRASYVDGYGTPEAVTSAGTAAVTQPLPLTLTGTSGADTLTGGGANDLLDGWAGLDSLDGRGGSDLYLVAAVADHPAAEIHDSGAAGIDELRFTSTTASTLRLFAGDTGLEKVVIGTGTGSTANTSGTKALNVDASAVTNGLTLIGNAGKNVLVGTASADILIGGAGSDTLTGGGGVDAFVFDNPGSSDTITDFQHGVDQLQMSKAVFQGLSSTGLLGTALFWSGAGVTKAHDADDRFLYNTTTGALYYDADGTGKTSAVQLGLLGASTHPLLTAGDILVF